MRSLSDSGVAALLIGTGVLLTSLPAVAVETSNAEFVIVQEDDVFPDDLYAGAVSVVVDGTLDGDLIAFAAEDVVINGTVTGSVMAVTPSVTVDGEVGGSLRVVANRLEVNGVVGDDLVAALLTADLGRGSEVARDVLVWGWSVAALGSIGEDLTGVQRNLELAGSVGGDVDVTVDDFDVVDQLTVAGDLGFRSGNEAAGLDQADVGGVEVAKEPLPPNLRVRALTLLGRFMIVLFLTIAALMTAYGWRGRTERAVAAMGRKPMARWLMGALIIFAPVLAIAITAVILALAPAAAAFPLLLVLVPVILALFGLSFALALVAGTPVVGWLGGVLVTRFDVYGAILAGSIVVGVVWYLPWIGWLVPVVVMPLGLGAWMVTWRQEPAVSSTP